MTAEDTRVEAAPDVEDWRRFSSLSRMTNHWERPGWTDDRQAYYWYLTFDSNELRQLAATCQQDLALPYLDPVPPLGLHMTLPKIAWADEVSLDEVQRVAEAASAGCSATRRFTLSVGPLSGSSGAVRFSVSPWDRVIALHRHLRGATASVLGRAGREDEFRPHIGIAYCNSAVPAGPLIERVAALRTLPTVTVGVERVDLVLIRREARTYAWATVESLPLG